MREIKSTSYSHQLLRITSCLCFEGHLQWSFLFSDWIFSACKSRSSAIFCFMFNSVKLVLFVLYNILSHSQNSVWTCFTEVLPLFFFLMTFFLDLIFWFLYVFCVLPFFTCYFPYFHTTVKCHYAYFSFPTANTLEQQLLHTSHNISQTMACLHQVNCSTLLFLSKYYVLNI